MNVNVREKYKDHYEEVQRPAVVNHFLGMCFFIAERSEDAETRHGAILTDQHNHIIGTGFNAFSKGTPPGSLPNKRPLKHDHVIHAEENALLNTTMDPLLVPGGAILYCTAKPCLRCLYLLNNKGFKTLYCADTGYNFGAYEKEQEDFLYFTALWGIRVYSIKPDLAWINRPVTKLQGIGLLH